MSVDPVKAAAGRIGAMVTLSRHDPSEITKAARAGTARKWELVVDAKMELDPTERARRADYARRAHMQRLAFASARARAARKAATS